MHDGLDPRPSPPAGSPAFQTGLRLCFPRPAYASSFRVRLAWNSSLTETATDSPEIGNPSVIAFRVRPIQRLSPLSQAVAFRRLEGFSQPSEEPAGDDSGDSRPSNCSISQCWRPPRP